MVVYTIILDTNGFCITNGFYDRVQKTYTWKADVTYCPPTHSLAHISSALYYVQTLTHPRTCMHAHCIHTHRYTHHDLYIFHRSLTCPKSCAPPIDKHQQRQQQQQQQKPKPIPRQRPQIQPRTNPPQPRSPPSPESYEYMSSKGVPSPEEQNFCGDPNETLGRYGMIICMKNSITSMTYLWWISQSMKYHQSGI